MQHLHCGCIADINANQLLSMLETLIHHLEPVTLNGCQRAAYVISPWVLGQKLPKQSRCFWPVASFGGFPSVASNIFATPGGTKNRQSGGGQQ
jgi:hypothetical protein